MTQPITRPGLTELQDGAMVLLYGVGAGFVAGLVVGIVLTVIAGLGLAAFWRG